MYASVHVYVRACVDFGSGCVLVFFLVYIRVCVSLCACECSCVCVCVLGGIRRLWVWVGVLSGTTVILYCV